MADTKVSIINASTVLTDEQVQAVIPALQEQVHKHLLPAWGIDADLFFVSGTQPPSAKDTSWWLVILDTSDDAEALGYHDFTPTGRPIGKVFAKSDLDNDAKWTVTASHELLEMLVDPDIVRTVFVQDSNTSGVIYAYEVCDACEADNYSYAITAGGQQIDVSDFVFPAWFEPSRQPGSTQFDYQKAINKPLDLLQGGYIGMFDVGAGTGWHQQFAEKEEVKELKQARARIGSRRERRNVPRNHWRRSEPDREKLVKMLEKARQEHLVLR